MISRKAVIISAPSGSGKTTIVKHLISVIPGLKFSVSATSRKPRENEIDGKDYYYMSPEKFKEGINNNWFIEWEEVYEGFFYGTLKAEIDRIWSEGNNVIFDVDVKGGITLKNYFGDAGLSLFISVKNLKELEERLRSRKTDSEEVIQNRIKKAVYENGFRDHFDKIILNDDLARAVREAEDLVREFLNTE
jgi:guanylate kinase